MVYGICLPLTWTSVSSISGEMVSLSAKAYWRTLERNSSFRCRCWQRICQCGWHGQQAYCCCLHWDELWDSAWLHWVGSSHHICLHHRLLGCCSCLPQEAKLPTEVDSRAFADCFLPLFCKARPASELFQLIENFIGSAIFLLTFCTEVATGIFLWLGTGFTLLEWQSPLLHLPLWFIVTRRLKRR